MQGAQDAVIESLEQGLLDRAPVDPMERALLEFVHKITLHSNQIVAGDSQQLRDAGWSDPQIAEAVYIAAIFAFFNRVADAFGLADPNYRETGLVDPPPHSAIPNQE